MGRGRLHPRASLTEAGLAARRPIRVAHVATVDLTLRFLLLPQLERLREAGYEVTGISAPGPWVAELEAAGIRHVAWHNATRSWDLRADGRAYAELTRILRDGRFDVVHTHNPKPGVMGRIAARRSGVPVVVNTVHGLYAKPEDRLRRRVPVLALEGLAARFSDLELYQSEEDLAWARRLGVVGRDRSVLLGNGTDLERFRPDAVDRDTVHALRDELGIPRDAVVVGAVGRLVAEKGYLELFEAARRVRAGRPNVRFLVVGSPDEDKSDGIGRDELAAAADDVVFAGWRTDVRDLLAAMDVFVLASWREGLPRSAVEAAAMARPMVLTDIRGCREVARDEVEGLLVPPRDPDALTEAIGRLVDDEALRTRLGAAARTRAVERFDERAVARTIVEHYGRLVERHVPGRMVAETTEAEVLDLSLGARIRPARPQDAPYLARLHREALPDSFLPLLGQGFLRRLLRGPGHRPGGRGRGGRGRPRGGGVRDRSAVRAGLLPAVLPAPRDPGRPRRSAQAPSSRHPPAGPRVIVVRAGRTAVSGRRAPVDRPGPGLARQRARPGAGRPGGRLPGRPPGPGDRCGGECRQPHRQRVLPEPRLRAPRAALRPRGPGVEPPGPGRVLILVPTHGGPA